MQIISLKEVFMTKVRRNPAGLVVGMMFLGTVLVLWPCGASEAQGQPQRPNAPVVVENDATQPVPVAVQEGANISVEAAEGRLPVELEEPVVVMLDGVVPTSQGGDTFLKFSDLTDFRDTPDKILNGKPYVVPEGKVLLIEDVSVQLFTLPSQTEAIARLRIQRPGFNERHMLGRTDPVSGDAGRRTAIVAAPGNRVSGEVRLLESREDLVRIITHFSGRLIDAEVVQTSPE